MDDEESVWNETILETGKRFFDFKHAETGAEVLKAQHPEYELWSQGIHARSGVACADCHMPYMREGAVKVSDHWVRSPLQMSNRACQVCHHFATETSPASIKSRNAITNCSSRLVVRLWTSSMPLPLPGLPALLLSN